MTLSLSMPPCQSKVQVLNTATMWPLEAPGIPYLQLQGETGARWLTLGHKRFGLTPAAIQDCWMRLARMMRACTQAQPQHTNRPHSAFTILQWPKNRTFSTMGAVCNIQGNQGVFIGQQMTEHRLRRFCSCASAEYANSVCTLFCRNAKSRTADAENCNAWILCVIRSLPGYLN